MNSGLKTDTTPSSPDVPADRSPSQWRSPAILPLIVLMITGALIARESMVALALTVLDGGTAAGVLIAAALAGGWLVRLLGLGGSSLRDRLMMGAGLGIGVLPLIVLGLGAAGWLTSSVALGLTGILAVAGALNVLVDAWPMVRSRRGMDVPGSGDSRGERRRALALSPLHFLWLLTCPFLAITAMAASLPPGILWREEAGGYDILEYHLAVPRQFYEAGCIFFMPFNVYSNFPLNSEMLSLLMMALRDDAIEATFMAQMANVALGMLFVAAAWWTGRLYSRPAGIVAGVLAATTPWVAYLAGIAYVEPGMLAMGMLSLGAMLRAIRPAKYDPRWLVTAGLLAGLSAGFKYTAVPLIVVPIAMMPLFARASFAKRLRQICVFVLASMIAFSPWMIRNVINTGNPVFPLAYQVFGAKAGTWDDALDARWRQAHGLAGSGLSPEQSLWGEVWRRTAGDPRLGLLLIGLAGAGAVIRRDRWTAALLAMLVLQFGIWFFATHLFARFAVALVLPLVVLASRLVESECTRGKYALLSLILILGAWLNFSGPPRTAKGDSVLKHVGIDDNLYGLAELYYYHTRIGERPLNMYGRTRDFEKGNWPGFEAIQAINELEGRIRVLMVGEARTYYVRPPCTYAVVFNHHPLSEAVRRYTKPDQGDVDAQAVIEWMRQQGFTHVLVNWSELMRLSSTYGLDERLDGALFAELQSAGLTWMGDWSLEDNAPPYVTAYEVPYE